MLQDHIALDLQQYILCVTPHDFMTSKPEIIYQVVPNYQY